MVVTSDFIVVGYIWLLLVLYYLQIAANHVN